MSRVPWSRVPWCYSLRNLQRHLLLNSSAPAISSGNVANPHMTKAILRVQHRYHASTVASPSCTPEKQMQVRLTVLRRLEHGLTDRLIPKSIWRVLDNLHRAGYEAYLVGGSVRDLLLKQSPKDFDILSTAEPEELKRSFRGQCFVVGKRFPVCHVHSHGTTIEVSSFSTRLGGKRDRNKSRESFAKDSGIGGTEGWDERDFARWENSLRRDFTVNALMYDPFKQLLYDYVGGLRDLRKLKVRTVMPADESFIEDSARILRAIRVAARLGLRFAKSTSCAIKNLRFSLLKLNKGRLMLETNTFFSYGAAEPSLRLLWRYGILELLLPLQAAYFAAQNFKRQDTDSNLLLDLFRNLDKMVAPDRPCQGSLWVALLAFHLAVSDRKSSPLVTATAALTMHHADDKRKAAEKAKRLHLKAERKRLKVELEVDDVGLAFSEEKSLTEESLIEEAGLLLEHAKSCLNRMMDSTAITVVMQELTGLEPEDLAAVGQTYSTKVYRLFNEAARQEFGFNGGKESKKVLFEPEDVARGDADAICYLFSLIVLNTLYPRKPKKAKL